MTLPDEKPRIVRFDTTPRKPHKGPKMALVTKKEQTTSPSTLKKKKRLSLPRALFKALKRSSTASLSYGSSESSLIKVDEQDEELQQQDVSLLKNTVTLPASSEEDGTKLIKLVRSSVIGNRCVVKTVFGTDREIVYADYTASGRALSFVEDYMVNLVSPLYANTHTEASLTGAQTTHLREQARDMIHTSVKAPKEDYAVLFTGTGSTGAIDKLIRVLGLCIPEYANKRWNLQQHIPEQERPVVFISHFEHHSNELIWRESIARVVVIDEDADGLPNLEHLEQELVRYKQEGVPLIGSFSAGSNVTGIKSDTHAMARVLHKHGAYAFFDYAGVGAYVDIDVVGDSSLGDSSMDAVFLSPHKFVGGPGAAGVLVAKRKLFSGPFGIPTSVPSVAGGGTVAFVSQYNHAYISDIEVREDAGTPGIPQCIRAGLVFWLKDQVGSALIEGCEARHNVQALEAWSNHPRIALMGAERPACSDPSRRVPIFSFNVLSPVDATSRKFCGKEFARSVKANAANSVAGQVLPVGCANMTPKAFQDMYASKLSLPLHQNFIIALLNDVYGIQGRGGCSCAGPYGHVLFGVGGEEGKPVSETLHRLAVRGYESFKPGWARINLNYFVSDDEVNFFLEAVRQIASFGWKLLPYYTQDLKSGKYTHLSFVGKKTCPFSMSDISLETNGDTAKIHYPVPTCLKGERSQEDYDKVLTAALDLYQKAEQDIANPEFVYQDFTTSVPEGSEPGNVWWLRSSEAAKKLLRDASRREKYGSTSFRGVSNRRITHTGKEIICQ